MRTRLAILPLLLLGAVACPKDRKGRADSVAVAPPLVEDTTHQDLSSLPTSLPPVAPDTFKPRRPPANRQSAPAPRYPDAPEALVAAVQRSQTFSRFCYQEFGQKSDPTLRGGVAMLVTVDPTGVSDARVADDNWTSSSGKAVNDCLNERAKLAWKLSPGEVKSGKYYVQLAFTGS
ncbi:MAG: hypothetical protein ACJ79S_06505 [Gemmatimonadaceae bacterium]